MPTHSEAIAAVLDILVDPVEGVIKSVDEIDAVGHRVVQGGDLFEKSCLVTPEVEKGIEGLIDLAPVHTWATCVVSVPSTHSCRTRRR